MDRGFFIHWLTRVDADTVVGVVTAIVGVAKETVVGRVDLVALVVGGVEVEALVVSGEEVVAEGVGVPQALEAVAVVGGVGTARGAILSAYCSRIILAYRAGERQTFSANWSKRSPVPVPVSLANR
jgi:hypothetical protein